MITRLNPEQLADFLQSKPNAKIKIFNLGENIGMDLAYFCHYAALRKLFPEITLDLRRSNVDETNCIGFDQYHGRAELPVSSMRMAVVSQRYPDGTDWVQKIQAGHFNIFDDEFRNTEGYDIIWDIGFASMEPWLKQFNDPNLRFVNSSTVCQAVEIINKRTHKLVCETQPLDIASDVFKGFHIWERTALEYLVMNEPDYPVKFTEDFSQLSLGRDYKEYLRISLRWPDNVRWYYGIDRQYDVVLAVLKKIRESGKPVKVIYNLKDGEIGNNFCRGQSLDKIKQVMNACDDIVFTYSWTAKPYRHRPSEAHELAKLQGIGAKKIMRLNLWEDLFQSQSCKVYLSDPGGFAEVISILRKDNESTFLFPVSRKHLGTYLTLNGDRKPIRKKIASLCVDQSYACEPVLSKPDDPTGYRVLHWNMSYDGQDAKIGDNCNGDDWKYFEAAQDGLFRDWFNKSSPALIDAIVKKYLE